ncbi:pyridoxamine 5'-phosphate oxidase family protein [Bdellovibrio sp. KM01]|nr:pyridoxamine 5'-phosphate oxidase family protein [Bdellovibrio sp. KM01]QLY26408.1 pyridoxamine 5'-phosphate oxidase family protein [Bdellovibrio sp. KM01]
MKPHHGQIGAMNETEALKLMEENRFAHLACHNRDDIYLVPISYICTDGFIYSHSESGRKIDIMRKNPHVCVQVEKIEDYSHWKSVIAWGDFEELHGYEANEAMRLL